MHNIDHETGIRYGVIPVRDIIFDDFEPVYNITCPDCGTEEEENTHCSKCGKEIHTDFEHPLYWMYEKDGYVLVTDTDCIDVFVVKSPYYTFAKFCSPCAPGACDLTAPAKNGNKCYCLDETFFENAEGAPYTFFKA